jgi:hypothetical protein
MHVYGTQHAASRSLMQHWIEGDENGTRTFALATGCAYPDHHFVVAVLRPLSGRGFSNEIEVSLHRAPLRAEPDLFFRLFP